MAGQATDKSKGVLGPGPDELDGQIAALPAGRRAISGQLKRAERARAAAASELDVEPQLEIANRVRDEPNGGPGSIAFRRLSSLLQPAYVFVSFTEGGGGSAAGVYATTLQELLPQLGKGADPELRLVDLVGRLRERSGTQEVRLTMAPVPGEANVLVVDCEDGTVAVCAPDVAPGQAFMTWSFKEFVRGQWDGPFGIGEMIEPGHAQRWGILLDAGLN